ncbi:MAG: periplasmic heavy metal sensor [Deltaproteobacteria bacterium]|nr:periplasmic heavy metal sensor [Deltaproteobacteria bacterium]
MVFVQVLLGIIVSAALLRIAFGFAWRRRMRRMGGRPGFGPGGRGFGGPPWARRRRAWHMFASLDLSSEQRKAARELFREVRDAVRELRPDWRGDLASLFDQEEFDRDVATGLADAQLAALSRVKDIVLGAVERLHALLTPEQREKVVAHLSGCGPRHAAAA